MRHFDHLSLSGGLCMSESPRSDQVHTPLEELATNQMARLREQLVPAENLNTPCLNSMQCIRSR